MNRTININISGIVFYIDEAAYEKLQNYLATIKGYFKNTDGGDEIMGDIESRIAEMFQQKVGATKQALSMKDIDDVIEIMGKPENFATEETNSTNTQKEQAQATNTTSNQSAQKRTSRLYRDADDKVLGGVCSGITHYFGWSDPVWLRLALALAFFVGGFGLLIYIILWAIVPKAVSTSEKLEMKGEKVTIASIEKTIREELNDVKDRVEKGGLKNDITNFFQKLVSALGQVFGSFFKVIFKIISVFIVIIGGIMLFVLITVLFSKLGVISSNIDGHDIVPQIKFFLDSLFPSPTQLFFTKLGLAIVIGLPILMIVYGCTKFLLNIKTNHKWVKRGSTIVWFVGLILLIVGISTVGEKFSSKATHAHYMSIPTSAKELILKAMNDEIEEEDDVNISVMGYNFSGSENSSNDMFRPQLNIEKSKGDSVYLKVVKYTRGENKKEVATNLAAITYNLQTQDSAIIIDNYFNIGKEKPWRNQRLRMTLCIPVGHTIYLSPNLKYIIYDIKNVTNTFDDDMLGRKWIMTTKGLTCVDCDGIEDLNRVENNADDIDDAIEEGDDVVLDINNDGVKINGKKVKEDQDGKNQHVDIDAEAVDVNIDEHGVKARIKGKAKESDKSK